MMKDSKEKNTKNTRAPIVRQTGKSAAAVKEEKADNLGKIN